MTAAARPLPHPAAPALVSAEHVHDLIGDVTRLTRDLKAARVRADNAIRQLERVLHETPDRPLSMVSYEGALTVLMASGAVRMLKTREVAADEPMVPFPVSGFVREWIDLPALPQTAAAILADVDAPEYAGMAVIE